LEPRFSETAQFSRTVRHSLSGWNPSARETAAVLRMERPTGTLQLKVAVTELALGGTRYRLISLQNIESEMSAQEMVAMADRHSCHGP